MKVQNIVSVLGVAIFAIMVTACGTDKSENKRSVSTEPVERLDSRSVPLYRAERKAKAEDFRVSLVNGNTFQLSNQRGKVVLLNIWATWCAPCREEIPEFVELRKKYAKRGFEILGVSIDKQGKSVVKPFMEKYNINYPIVIDDGTIMEKYGPTMGLPTSYIIGKEGNLQYFATGAITQKELEPRLKKLLSK